MMYTAIRGLHYKADYVSAPSMDANGSAIYEINVCFDIRINIVTALTTLLKCHHSISDKHC